MKLTTIVREISDRVRLAKSVAALTGGTSGVDAVSVTSGGSGYANSFAVTFTGGGGSGAAGTATAIGGVVVSVEITDPGSGYTSAPVPDFSAGGGTGAAGTAILTAQCLDAIPTVELPTGLVVFFVLANAVQFYVLTAGTEAESSPDVIRPDDYAAATNEKVWKLASTLGSGGSGPAAWGDITGTLANQTDLQGALDAKADEVDLGDAAGKDVGTGSGDVAAGNRGLPSGGVAGQVLRKQSGTDHDVAWGAEGLYASKSADEQRNSDTLADDTDLTLSLKAGQKYLVEAELWFWEPAADGSVQVTWTLPSLTGNATRMEHLLSFTDGALRYKHEEATSFTVRTDSNSGAAMCQVRSSIVLTPGADGSIALRWAKETGGGTSGPTLKKGSWVRASVVG